jgi:FKBP-type peptidyl-prolyl cis-trans isomerase FkpA
MKQTFFTLLLLSAIGLTSCRKNSDDNIDIQQFDQKQILSYIAANGIKGMVADSTHKDTSGIYYKVTIPGTGPKLTDTNTIAFVFSLKSFDGLYTSTDTIYNQYDGYVGHITGDALPYGLYYAIVNNLKYNGGAMRVLIPSHLAYGINGYGTGSVHAAGRIAGNQCLDYYVHLITTTYRPSYDDVVIQNYMKQNSLNGYTRSLVNVPPGFYGDFYPYPGNYYMYYKVIQPGTGTDSINNNSTIRATYTGELLDLTNFDTQYNGTDTASINVPDLAIGLQAGLSHVTTGASLSVIIPSRLAYGSTTGVVASVPPNSCVRYEYKLYSVTP